MKPLVKKTPYYLKATLVAAAIGMLNPMAAQSSSEDTEQVVILSPFEVNAAADYGYAAANTLAGGRLSTAMLETPVSTNVLTRELLDDLGITDVQSALAWSLGTLAATDSSVVANADSGDSLNGRPEMGSNYNNLSIRGFSQVTVSRNYFPWFVNSDGYNTERIDVSRGPNALIFGDAGTGGIVNVSTKRAHWTPRKVVKFEFSDEGALRGSADINLPINKQFAVRLNLLGERSSGWRDFYENDRDGVHLAATFAPSNRTQLRVEAEYGEVERLSPALYIRDLSSSWNGTTTFSTRFTGNSQPASATGTRRIDAAANLRNQPYLMLDLGNISQGFVDMQGWGISAGTGMPLELTVPLSGGGLQPIPIEQPAVIGQRGFRVLPDHAYSARVSGYLLTDKYHAQSVFFEQQLTDNLFLEIAGVNQKRDQITYTPASHNQLYIDVNSKMPDGSDNPNFLKPYIGGSGHRPISTEIEVQELRASIVYLLNTAITSQRIGFIASKRFDSADQRFLWLSRTNGPNPDVTVPGNYLYTKAYLDGGRGASLPMRVGDVVTFNDGTRAEFVASARGGNSYVEGSVTSLQAFASGSWLESKRLHTIVGVRSDHVETDVFAPQYDAVTNRLLGFASTPNAADSVDRTVTSPSAGAIYRVADWFRPYANYSKTFKAPSGGTAAFDIFGGLLPVVRGEGWDYGVKFELWDKRIVGSLGYYVTEEQNTPVSVGALADPINQISALMGGQDLVYRAYRDTRDTRSTGVELDITANLTRSWSLVFNVALPESEVTKTLPRYRALIDELRPEWEAIANNPADPIANNVQSNLSAIDSQFALFEDGMPIIGKPEYITKIFTRYRFGNGFFIGGGATSVGKILRANDVGAAPIYSKGYTTLSGLLGYSFTALKTKWTAQANISNLLDDEHFRYTAYDSQGRIRQYSVAAPRDIKISLTASF